MRSDLIFFYRKQHEQLLLSKVDDVEMRLNNYLNNLTKTIEDVKSGMENIKLPIFDTDAVDTFYNIFKIYFS